MTARTIDRELPARRDEIGYREQEKHADDALIEMFLALCEHSAHTLQSYERGLLRFRVFLNFMPLKDVTWKEIEAYKLALIRGICTPTQKTLAPASVSALIAPIKALYKWGSDPNIGLLPRNPTTSIR